MSICEKSLYLPRKTLMTDFYTTLLTLLKQDPRFTAQDGTFLRNAVYEAKIRKQKPAFSRRQTAF